MTVPPSVKLDGKLQDNLQEFKDREDIPDHWRNTPIEDFIMSQNFQWPVTVTGKPEVLISACIEFRYALPVPRGYAYVIRRASGRVLGSEFSVGYVLSKGVKFLLLIGHNDCGMAKVAEAAPNVVDAFVDQGWSRAVAEEYVRKQGARHAITNEIDALEQEYLRLRKIFPRLKIAPLFICLYDSKVYLPKWYEETYKRERYELNSDMVPEEVLRALF
jgi:hypothetical protein